MGLILPRSVFIHLAKTGGTSVRKACEALGLAEGETGDPGQLDPVQRRHSPYAWLKGEIGDRHVFASVRDTLGWYQSQWCHKTRHPDHGAGIISDENYRPDFAEWIQHVTTAMKGHYGWYIRHMLGSAKRPYILRTNRLFADLEATLIRLGEKFDVHKLRCMTPQNRAGTERLDALWTEDLAHLVWESEGEGEYPRGIAEELSKGFVTPIHGKPRAEPKYVFDNWVSPHEEHWRKLLAKFRGQPVRALEVGVWEGRSSIWFLENILTNISSTLTTIDPDPKAAFTPNLESIDAIHRVCHYRDLSRNVIPRLDDKSFAFAYIDGGHNADDCLRDCLDVLPKIQSGGIILIDDYSLQPNTGHKGVKPAVDAFLQVFDGYKVKQIHHNGIQVAVEVI
jgi:predicted O-methyltransferase YrrM